MRYRQQVQIRMMHGEMARHKGIWQVYQEKSCRKYHNYIDPINQLFILRGEFNVRRTRGLTHRLEDGFNIIFQYNTPLLQCIRPIFLLSSLCL